jgi:hypothetical protein
MCYKAVSAVLESSKSVGSQRLLLVVLAHHMNSETGQCNPAIKTLAAKCMISERSVQRNLKSLVELGELRIQSGATHARSNCYSLCLSIDKSPRACGNNPDTHVTHTPTPVSQRGDDYFHRKRRKTPEPMKWQEEVVVVNL